MTDDKSKCEECVHFVDNGEGLHCREDHYITSGDSCGNFIRRQLFVGLTPKGIAWVKEQAKIAGMSVKEWYDEGIKEFGFDKFNPDILKWEYQSKGYGVYLTEKERDDHLPKIIANGYRVKRTTIWGHYIGDTDLPSGEPTERMLYTVEDE